MKAPAVEKKPNWKEFALPFDIGSGRSFILESEEKQNMKIDFFSSDAGEFKQLEGRVWFGQGIEGPPLHVHGGVSSYVLDEAMGSVCWLNHFAVVAKKIEVEFLEMTPIHKNIAVEATIEELGGKIIKVKGKTFDPQEQKIYSQSFGLFYRLPKQRIMQFADKEKSDFDFESLIYPE